MSDTQTTGCIRITQVDDKTFQIKQCDDRTVPMTDTTQTTMIEEAVEAAIEAASEYVSSQPVGADKSWGSKEFRIAETAAREAIAALRQMESGK